jgi:uncharacterized protein with GYD domain
VELDWPRSKSCKRLSKTIASFKVELEKASGQLIGEYYTIGQYDGIVIVEAPSDETIMSILLGDASKGNFRSMTLKAFPMEEAAKVIEKLS